MLQKILVVKQLFLKWWKVSGKLKKYIGWGAEESTGDTHAPDWILREPTSLLHQPMAWREG